MRVLAVVAALVVAGCSGGSSSSEPSERTVRDAAKVPSSETQVEITTMPGDSTAVAAGLGSAWVGGPGPAFAGEPGPFVWRIDPESGRVTDTVEGVGGGALLVAGDSVWTAGPETGDATLHRIDPETMAVVDSVPLGGGRVVNAAPGDGYIWVLVRRDDETYLLRLEPDRKEVSATVALGDGEISLVSAADGAAWVVVPDESSTTLVRVDAASGDEVARIDVGEGEVSSLAATLGRVFFTLRADGGQAEVSYVNLPDDSLGEAFPVPVDPSRGVTIGDGALWAVGAGMDDGGVGVSRIDIASLEITDTVTFDDPSFLPTVPVVADGLLWGSSVGESFLVGRVPL